MAPLIGLLADRFGRREVLIPCLVAFGLFGGLSSFAPNFASLLALRLLQGVGSAGLINLAVVVIADHWAEPDRSRIIGQNSAVLTVSLAVLPPLGGFLTDVGGWRATFVPYWLGLVTAVWAAVELGRSEPREVRITQQVQEALGHLRSATVLAAVGSGMLLFVLVFGLLLTALPLYLDEGFGLGATDRGLVLGLPALTSTIAALSLGRLTTRYGARQLILAGSAVMAVSFAVVAGSPGLAMLVAGILFYGFGEGMAIPSLQTIVAGAAPSSSRGAVVAVWVGAVRAGQTIGPIAAGVAVSQLGAPATFLAGAGLAAALLAAQAISGHPAGSADRGH